MLNILRRQAGAWWIKVLLIAVALSFIIGFGILGSVQDKDTSWYVAKIDDTIITVDDFTMLYSQEIETLKEKYGDDLTEEDIAALDLKRTILETEIERLLILKEARRLELPVSDSEVSDIIANSVIFQDGGEFNYELYSDILRYNGLNELQFEEMIREDLMSQKLKDVVYDSVKITNEEAVLLLGPLGVDMTIFDEADPDTREFLLSQALGIKKYQAYDTYLDDLIAKSEIIINEEYLE
ncbi:MAG: SurA N-terminal domain-containing protein [Deltaproteobacteria bacterium]|nr:SurA N-terminal domain-containing protein [Candidatus Zymogenaceae bacterium]